MPSRNSFQNIITTIAVGCKGRRNINIYTIENFYTGIVGGYASIWRLSSKSINNVFVNSYITASLGACTQKIPLMKKPGEGFLNFTGT